MQYHNRRESSASVSSLGKTFACGDQPNNPQHFGCEGRLAFKPMFAKCSWEHCPCPAHVVVGLGSGRPQVIARGKESWAVFPPSQVQLCSTTHVGAAWGISPLDPRHICAQAQCSPKGPMF